MPAPMHINMPTSPSVDPAHYSQSFSSGMRSPSSPRTGFLGSFMRRPRSRTLEQQQQQQHQQGSQQGDRLPPPSIDEGVNSERRNPSPSSYPHPPTNRRRTTTPSQPSAPPLSHSHAISNQLQSQTSQGTQRASNNSSGSLNQQGPPSPSVNTTSDPLAAFGSRLLRRISNQGSPGGGGGGNGGVGGPLNPNIASSALAPSSTLTALPTPQASTNSSRPYQPNATADDLAPPAASSSSEPSSITSGSSNLPTHRLRLVPVLDLAASLSFDPVLRDVRQSLSAPPHNSSLNDDTPGVWPLKIGRFSDKQNGTDGNPRGGALTSTKIAFKSKVVSRCHAEIWVLEGGSFFIRDTKSSSGTFLNHLRLAPPGQESRPFPLKDGDVVQLGVDYQGGTEDIYRSIKMRVEIGRAWQLGANNFNTNALKQLNALGGPNAGTDAASVVGKEKGKKVSKASVTDCCICLFSVTICQSLFIAPCSHVFHYKCIRPLLAQHHPGFSCPLCRSFADLEADVETEDAWEVASARRASISSRKGSIKSLKSVKAAFELGLGHALIAGGEGDGDADEDEQQQGGEGSGRAVSWEDEEDDDLGGMDTPGGRIIAAASMERAETERPDTAVGPSSTSSFPLNTSSSFLGQRGRSEEATPVVRQVDQFGSSSSPSSSPDGSNRSSRFVVSSTPTPSPLGVNNPFASIIVPSHNDAPPNNGVLSPTSAAPPTAALDSFTNLAPSEPLPALAESQAINETLSYPTESSSPSAHASEPLSSTFTSAPASIPPSHLSSQPPIFPQSSSSNAPPSSTPSLPAPSAPFSQLLSSNPNHFATPSDPTTTHLPSQPQSVTLSSSNTASPSLGFTGPNVLEDAEESAGGRSSSTADGGQKQAAPTSQAEADEIDARAFASVSIV